MPSFKVGDVVQVGLNGEKGKIIEVYRPLGTYCMFKVHMMTTGNITTAAQHELIKGLPDHDFQDLFNCFETPLERSTTLSTINENDIYPQIQSPPPPPPAITRPVEANKRFAELPVNPREFILEKENLSTKSKTSSHVKLLKEFLNSKNEPREPQDIEPHQLNEYLMEFILSVRQKDGSEYEPCSLRSMLSSFDRHLKQHGYATSIARGEPFTQTMMVFSSKGKDLKQKGMGNKPKTAAPVTDDEIQQLYESNQLGNANPSSVINTLWLNNTLHFGMRAGGAEHRQLMWGDVELHFDTVLSCEYLAYNERQTKTRTGIDINNIRDSKPRMYATGSSDTCPVATYKLYADQRPDDFSGPEHPFYLAVVTHCSNPGITEQWFLRSPIGKNKLNGLMKAMAKKAGLPELQQGKRLTNTSIRKRLCQKLLQSNVPDTYAVHVTGHKNSNSLNNYRTLTPLQQKAMSNILASSSMSKPLSASSCSIGSLVAPVNSGPSFHAALVSSGPTNTAVPVSNGSAVESVPASNNGDLLVELPNHDTAIPYDVAVESGSGLRKSTVLAHSRKRTISSQSGIAPYLFQNATITGGTINITINTGSKRRRETDSQEDILSISQED